MFSWWSDTIREAHEGHHTRVVSLHLRYGMIMFIASEVMFFVAWFWAFFDASLFPGDAAQVARDRVHRRRLAAAGDRGPRSVPPAALQHHHPAPVRHDGDLGAPRAAARRPQGTGQRPGADRGARRSVLDRPGLRIRPCAFRLPGIDLRRHLLHGDRLPRLPRADRHVFPPGLPDQGDPRGISRRPGISGSRRPPGTGISSTWSGCSSTPMSMSGPRPGRPSRTAIDLGGPEASPATGREQDGRQYCLRPTGAPGSPSFWAVLPSWS